MKTITKHHLYSLGSVSALGLLLAVPATVSAQLDINTGYFSTAGTQLIGFVNNTLVPLLFAVAFLVFIYGIYQYFIAGGSDPEKQSQGRQLAVYAIIGFVLIVALWGIVAIIRTLFGIQGNVGPLTPQVPGAPTINTGDGSVTDT